MLGDKSNIKKLVIKTYSSIATNASCCATPLSCCASTANNLSLLEVGIRLGYSDEELKIGLGEANLGLGCGNPLAIASLKAGEKVLDLGSGAGFDAFLSSMKVRSGHVIGIDMTAEMIAKAKENAEKLVIKNVEFKIGEIEHLPVEDDSIDVIISNCVINLSPYKQAVYKEVFRVLKPGGRLAISDVLKKAEFPEAIRKNEDAYSAWITGSVPVEELKEILKKAGFSDIVIHEKENSDEIIKGWNFGEGVEKMVFSAYIQAKKPSN